MIEFPEAFSLAKQLNSTIKNKKITNVIAGHTEHKLSWYYGNREDYLNLLKNKTITKAQNLGGLVEIAADNIRILYGDGVNLRYIENKQDLPQKHQLLIEFSDNTYLCASIQMYGGIGCFKDGELDNKYYLAAKQKPSPLTKEFSRQYFNAITANEKAEKLSVKGLLATEQRIPGLGNGILQDILFNAGLHPKMKVKSLTDTQIKDLFNSIKSTLKEMADKSGRDTEKDLFGQPGKYETKMSKKTVGKPCLKCSAIITKASYMGGSIYFCPQCQVF